MYFGIVERFLLTRILPTQARYWGMPWRTHEVQITCTREFGGIRGVCRPAEYLLHQTYFFTFTLFDEPYKLQVDRVVWEKNNTGDTITLSFRYSRLGDAKSTCQIRLLCTGDDHLQENLSPNRPTD